MKLYLLLPILLMGCATMQGVKTDAKSAMSAVEPAPTQQDASKLAQDFALATQEACEAVSATDPAPIDPLACTCNTFITAALPSIKIGAPLTGMPIADLERLRVLRYRISQSNFADQFRAACGGLYMSIRADAINLIAFIGLLK